MYCQQVLTILGCNSYCKCCTLYTLYTMCILRGSLQYRLYSISSTDSSILLPNWPRQSLYSTHDCIVKFPILHSSLYCTNLCTSKSTVRLSLKKNRLYPLASWPGIDRTTHHWAIPWACSSRPPFTRQDIFQSEPARL